MKIKLSPDEDYLNNERTRNSQNCEIEEYNCGGFALETYSWYRPFPRNHMAEDYIEGYLYKLSKRYLQLDMFDNYIKELLTRRATKTMLKDFPNLRELSLEEVKGLPKEKKLIAFRIGYKYNRTWICFDKFEHSYDYDFHYVVRLKGSWFEKMGSSSIRKVKFQFESWENGYLTYDSRIVFLTEK